MTVTLLPVSDIILLPIVLLLVHNARNPLVPLLVEPICTGGYSTTTPVVALVAINIGLINDPLAVGAVTVKAPAVASDR